ncbi:MAG: hypothetical protein H7Z72_21820 [Bacteroidetes bacterium]|nr:hypothetical protein [Fibrella sp.]
MKEYFYSKFDKKDWSWREPMTNVPLVLREWLNNFNNSLKSKLSATKLLYHPFNEDFFLIADRGNAFFEDKGRAFSFRHFLYIKNESITNSNRFFNIFNQLLPIVDITNPEVKIDFETLEIVENFSETDTRKIFEIIIENLIQGDKICIVNKKIPASLPEESYGLLTFVTFPTFFDLKEALSLLPVSIVASIPFILNYEDGYINKENEAIQLIYCGSKPLVPASYLAFNETAINFNNLQIEGYKVNFLDQFQINSTKFGSLFDLTYDVKNTLDNIDFLTTLLNHESTYNKLALRGMICRFANLIYLYCRKEEEYTGGYNLFVAINHSSYGNKIPLLKQHLAFVPIDEIIAQLDEYDEICVQNELRDEVPYVLRNRFDVLTLTELNSLIARLPSPEKSEVVKNVLVNSIQDRITSWEDFVALYDCKTLNPLILSLSKNVLLKTFVERVSGFWKDFDAVDFQTISISHLPALTYLYELTSKHSAYPRLLLTCFKYDGDGRWFEAADKATITLPFKLPLENDEGFTERMGVLEKVEAKYRNLPLLKELENQLVAYLPRTKFAQQYIKFHNVLNQQPVAGLPPGNLNVYEPPSTTGPEPVKAAIVTDPKGDRSHLGQRFNTSRVELQNHIYSWVTRPITIQVYHFVLAAFISLVFVLISWLWVSGPNTTSSQFTPPMAVQSPKPVPIDSVARAIAEAESFLNRMYFQGDTAINPVTFQKRADFKGMQFMLVKDKIKQLSRLQIKKIDTLPNAIWWNRFVKLYRDSIVVVKLISPDSNRTERITRLKIDKMPPKIPTIQ